MRCIKRYQAIYSKFPGSDQAAWALYHCAKMYIHLYGYSGRTGDLDEGMALHESVVKEYQGHSLADDSQYLLGMAYYIHKKDPTRAYIEFLKVDIKFPGGDMRPNARKMLDKLAAQLGNKGVHVVRLFPQEDENLDIG